MTTMEIPTVTSFLVMKLNSLARKRAEKATRPITWVQSFIRLVWHIAGFSSLTTAGFMWDMIAGFIVLGLSCFVMSQLTTSNPPQQSQQNWRG